MDGRDLLCDVFPNWTPTTKLYEVCNQLPKFLEKVIDSLGYRFFGTFHVGAKYDLTNFDHMLVSKHNM